MTAVPVTASIVSSISHYQEVQSMGEKISDENLLSQEIFNVINQIMIVFSLYSLLTFQVSFLPHVFQLIDNLFEKCKGNLNLNLEEPEQRVSQIRNVEKREKKPQPTHDTEKDNLLNETYDNPKEEELTKIQLNK